MVEYRRGIASKRKNDLWHFHPECESYPTKTFAIRQQKPLDSDLCSQCSSLAEDMRVRAA
jgi:hypothetical protein